MILLFEEIIIWKAVHQSTITPSLIKIELFIFEFITKKIIMFKKLFYNFVLILNNL
jgi:hypothetical protein